MYNDETADSFLLHEAAVSSGASVPKCAKGLVLLEALGNPQLKAVEPVMHHQIRISSEESVMCGRYRLSRHKQLIAEYFDTESEVDWEPRYNIAPSQDVGVIRQNLSTGKRRFSRARWGLIPSWANDAKIGLSTINARAETVTNKPAFRDALTSRRCLIPADGFYEWQRNGREKQPLPLRNA